MLATYRHIHTYEQITGRGRNTWKKPEPPTKPKPKQYFILGMEVDYNTYREYNYEKSWTIDGDVLKGITCTIWTLERYATDEHAKDYPIEAANARKILEQIREEIATITGKDDKNMKTPRTAADFIAALNDIYTESRNVYAVLQDKADKAKAKMDKLYDELNDHKCTDKRLAQLRYDTARGEYLLAEEARWGEYQEMISGHEKKVAELRVKFSEYLEELYAANPDNLDQSTMKLLESGICSPAELYRLAERHKDNPTMLRIIGIYAEKKREKYPYGSEESATCTSIITAAKAASNGNRELAVFDSAVSAVAYGLDKDFSHATRMHSYVDGWMETFKKQIMNLPVTPAEE